jgi:acyl carrier protein
MVLGGASMTFENFCRLVSDHSHTPVERIKENASFRDDLDIDSLQMVNLVVGLTQELKVGIDLLTSSDDMSTVGKLYQALIKDGNI